MPVGDLARAPVPSQTATPDAVAGQGLPAARAGTSGDMGREVGGQAGGGAGGAVLDHVPALVGVLDADGGWRWLSGAGLGSLGYGSADQAPDLLDMVPKQARSTLAGRLTAPEPGAGAFDLQVRHADGGYRTLRATVLDLRAEPAVHGVVLYTAWAPPRADGAGGARLARMVSHELRTPLTSVVSFAELLQEALDGSRDPALTEYVEVIERNGRRLVRLVEDLRMLASLEWEDEPLRLAAVDTGQLVGDALRAREAYCERKGLHLAGEVASGLQAQIDPDRMAQVLDNLVGNAAKYTPTGGRVTVRSRAEGTCWVVEVEDTGIGVPKEEQSRVFCDVFRASNTTTEGIPGTGMGLVIARVIVDKHGGRIAMTSEPGRGSTVSFRVPRWQGAP